MPVIELGYGRGSLAFVYDEARYRVLARSDVHEDAALSDVEIGERIDAPIESSALEEIISPNESVLVVVSDATRASASAQVINLLVRRLVQMGVAPPDINII